MRLLHKIVKFLTIVLTLMGIGIGLRNAGILGMLTGFLVPVMAGSGLILAVNNYDDGSNPRYRLGGLTAACFVVLATLGSSWRWGWACAIIAYLAGSVIGYALAWILRIKGNSGE
jgi:hypothetical protein